LETRGGSSFLLAGSLALLVDGPSREHLDANFRLEMIELAQDAS
jgi:hypothetical protein